MRMAWLERGDPGQQGPMVDDKPGGEVLQARQNAGLLRISGTWDELRGFTGTAPELRGAVGDPNATGKAI